MRLRPLHHSIIVEQEPEKEETQNGIYIAGDHRTFRKGKVLEVGKDVEYYNKGDTVMYVKEAAEEICARGEVMQPAQASVYLSRFDKDRNGIHEA